jgi:hypothetical protein
MLAIGFAEPIHSTIIVFLNFPSFYFTMITWFFLALFSMLPEQEHECESAHKGLIALFKI